LPAANAAAAFVGQATQQPAMFSIGAGTPKQRTTVRPRRRFPPHR